MKIVPPSAEARQGLIDRAVSVERSLRLAEAPARARVTYGDIWRAASLGDGEARARVDEAARDDPRVARRFAETLALSAHAVFEEVRAAHTGEVFARQAGAYAIEVRASASRPERCFLLITLAAGAAVPSRLVVVPAPDKPSVADLALPAPAGGQIQVVLPRDHPVLAAVQDIERPLHLA